MNHMIIIHARTMPHAACIINNYYTGDDQNFLLEVLETPRHPESEGHSENGQQLQENFDDILEKIPRISADF